MDFSVIYYIKWSVVAIFSVNPMHSVSPMSVKVMHHCTVVSRFSGLSRFNPFVCLGGSHLPLPLVLYTRSMGNTFLANLNQFSTVWHWENIPLGLEVYSRITPGSCSSFWLYSCKSQQWQTSHRSHWSSIYIGIFILLIIQWSYQHQLPSLFVKMLLFLNQRCWS